MPKNLKYIIGIIAFAFALFFSWYFANIIFYILIAGVISFLGKPIISLLDRVHYNDKKMSTGLKSALALIVIWTSFIILFSTLTPLVVKELRLLNNVDINNQVKLLQSPITQVQEFLVKYGVVHEGTNIYNDMLQSMKGILSLSKITNWFGSAIGTIGNILVALFAITFISFFFLKDSHLFNRIIMAFVPTRHLKRAEAAMNSIEGLLVRYFSGLVLEVLGVMTLNVIFLSIIGMTIDHAVVIGLITGILNLIPYIGPLLGICFGVLTGLLIGIDTIPLADMGVELLWIASSLIVTQLFDNIIFQPIIYGKSVYAHPIEIFLVIMMAGSVAGIAGMILAIPFYTVVRVVLKEFFNEYRLVQKLTQSLKDTKKENDI